MPTSVDKQLLLYVAKKKTGFHTLNRAVQSDDLGMCVKKLKKNLVKKMERVQNLLL